MTTIPVSTPSRSYDVIVGRGLLGTVGERVREVCGGEVACVVSDTNVAPLYAEAVLDSLERAGYATACVAFDAGERSKRLVVLGSVLEQLAEAGLTRGDVVIALGGGVVGDLAGLAAALYMRGCQVVQVPTSLLAMVDSSVGGKTAVDLEHGKNLAGAFFQPSAVVADVDCLSSLSHVLLSDSCGEVIKHGVIASPSLFSSLAAEPLNAPSVTSDRMVEVIAENVSIKRDVVNADERERGLRQTLNFGHTIGHAIEAENDYQLGHGSSVACGMCCIARASAALGICDASVASAIVSCVDAHGLPTSTRIPAGRLYERALSDKKRHGDTMNVVVPLEIGHVEVRRVTLDEFRTMVELGCTPSAGR